MCVTIEVALPTISTFLLVFSLRTGCFVILFWTSFRSCFGVLFFTSAILEVLVRRMSPLGAWIVPTDKKYYVESDFYLIFYLYVVMLVVEAVILLYAIFYLASGLYREKCSPLKQYLLCRIFTWMIEVTILFTLCLEHQFLIGWYLVMLLFVTLEFYSIIAVYSFYVKISEDDDENATKYSKEGYTDDGTRSMLEKMAYEFPRMTKCCCCFSLQTGSRIIAYGSIGIASGLFAAVTWSLVKVVNFVNSQNRNDTQEHTQEEMNQVALGVYISHAYFLLVLLFYFVISVLLLIGLLTNKTKYMRYYFTSGLFLLAMALALVVVTTIFFGLLATIPLLKWSLMLFYFLVVVRSTYLEMEEQNKPRMHEMQLL